MGFFKESINIQYVSNTSLQSTPKPLRGFGAPELGR